MINNANEISFRASANGHIMTGSRCKNEPISEGTKTHLLDLYISAKYGRHEEINHKFLDKGNRRAEDSIALLSLVKKRNFRKNELRLSNQYVTGAPRLFEGPIIHEALETFDIKTCWSAYTFFRAQKKPDPMHEWKAHTYMALTGANKHTLAFCLVNGTEEAITREKRKLAWSLNLIDPELDAGYRERCRQIEINHIFDLQAFIKEYPYFDFHSDLGRWRHDIPVTERLFTYEIQRDDAKIKALYEKITLCREWMNRHLFNNEHSRIPAQIIADL